MRTVKALFKNTDKTIDDITANFNIFKLSFQSHAVVDLAIQMYEMSDAIKSLGTFSYLVLSFVF